MNEQAKVRIKTNLAVQLLAWQWLNNQESGLEYAPPSAGQAIWEYQNVPMFARVVDSMSHYILGEIEAENEKSKIKSQNDEAAIESYSTHLNRAKAENARLRDSLQDLAYAPIMHDDPELDYLEVHVSREARDKANRVLEGSA